MEKPQPLLPNLIDTYDWRSIEVETAQDIALAFDHARKRSAQMRRLKSKRMYISHHVMHGMVTLSFRWESWCERWAFSIDLPSGVQIEAWTSHQNYDELLNECEQIIQTSISNA